MDLLIFCIQQYSNQTSSFCTNMQIRHFRLKVVDLTLVIFDSIFCIIRGFFCNGSLLFTWLVLMNNKRKIRDVVVIMDFWNDTNIIFKFLLVNCGTRIITKPVSFRTNLHVLLFQCQGVNAYYLYPYKQQLVVWNYFIHVT